MLSVFRLTLLLSVQAVHKHSKIEWLYKNKLASIFIYAYMIIISMVRVNDFNNWFPARHTVVTSCWWDHILHIYIHLCGRLYKHLRAKCFISEMQVLCWIAGCCYQFRLSNDNYKWKVLCQQSSVFKILKHRWWNTISMSCYLRQYHCANCQWDSCHWGLSLMYTRLKI